MGSERIGAEKVDGSVQGRRKMRIRVPSST